MPAFPHSTSSPPAGANSTIAPPSQADPAPLPAEDLTAARELVARGCYAQALVLAGALERLHGPHDALTQIAADCRAHLDVTQDTAVAIDTGGMGAHTPPLRRSG